jgi:hypothetical protein
MVLCLAAEGEHTCELIKYLFVGWYMQRFPEIAMLKHDGTSINTVQWQKLQSGGACPT